MAEGPFKNLQQTTRPEFEITARGEWIAAWSHRDFITVFRNPVNGSWPSAGRCCARRMQILAIPIGPCSQSTVRSSSTWKRFIVMPRLSYADTSSPELTSISDRVISERGSLLDLYRLLMHSPPIASGWLEFLTAVRYHLTLPPDLRELIIIRIALLNDAPYEARQHTPIALQSGATEDQIVSLRAWRENPSLFDDTAQAALAFTDSLTRDVKVPEPIWKSVRDRFSERECLELTVLISTYNMVSRVLSALELD